MGAGTIRVGTASWTDPGFVADWYPKGLPAGERLRWYANHFDMVEVNSSFYSVLNYRQVEKWCREVPNGFVFNVKLHRLLSRHSTAPKMLPPDLREQFEVAKDKVQLNPALEKELTTRFLREIEPFRQTRSLGALLLQLSPSFSPRHNALSELENLFALLDGYRVAVELRNRGWAIGEQLAKTEEFFRRHKVTFVCVDAPQDNHFMILPSIDVITNSKLVYLRVHGRDARRYITGKTVAERFNYKYSDEELRDMAQRAANLAKQAGEVHLIFNNNAHDYAPRDAARFRELFAEKFPASQLSWALGEKDKQKNEQETFSFLKL